MIQLQKRIILPLSFFLLILYIIFLADTANYNFGFALVKMIPYGDKVMHILLYGIMALLLNYGLNFKSYFIWKFNLQIGGILVFVFAAIEECSQYFIISRTFDMYDLYADIIGIVLFSIWKKKEY